MSSKRNDLHITFVHRFDQARAGSFKMRGLNMCAELKKQGVSADWRNENDRGLKLLRGNVLIFIKPLKLNLPKILSRDNIVIIDPLDDVHLLPNISLPFHFIFTSKRAREHYRRQFSALSSSHLPHHFDQRIFRPDNEPSTNSIGYVGDRQKLESHPKDVLQIKHIQFDEFLASNNNNRFHWTIKPIRFDYEPLTKTVTALAAGAIPIINTSELGEILPIDYPFHISPKASKEDLLNLKIRLNDKKELRRAQDQIKRIAINHYSVESSCEQLIEIIAKCRKNHNTSAFNFSDSFGILYHDIKFNLKRVYHRMRSRLLKTR